MRSSGKLILLLICFTIKSGSRILFGSSPEMLLRITGDKVETYPIAGSRPVSVDKETYRTLPKRNA